MKKSYVAAAGAALFIALVATGPASSTEAARGALSAWWSSVAPALLPFMIVVPALTHADMCAIYERSLGRVMGPIFNLPGGYAVSTVVGWLSGSPAGAASAARIAASGSVSSTRMQLTRAALLSSGASPIFLISAVGAGMLNLPGAGIIMWRSQLAAAVIVGLILSRLKDDGSPASAVPGRDEARDPVTSAIMSVLSIAVYMTLFGVLARRLSDILPFEAAELPLLAIFEMSGACRAISAASFSANMRTALCGAVACFGGLSCYYQSMAYVRPRGGLPRLYMAGKLMQAAISFGLSWLQLALSPAAIEAFSGGVASVDFPAVATICACALFAALIISRARSADRQPPA